MAKITIVIEDTGEKDVPVRMAVESDVPFDLDRVDNNTAAQKYAIILSSAAIKAADGEATVKVK